MLRVGIIGCGGMGTNHSNCYKAMSDKVKIVAVADLREEKAEAVAQKVGAKIYKTGNELLANEELDIVDVCLPTYLHTEYAVAAMKKGCNVFIEKPVCLNLEQAKELLDTQKKTGVKVQIGQVIRFWKEYAWVKKIKENGDYGKLLSANFVRLSPNPIWGWEDWYSDWKRSGSCALDLHIHDVDFVRYFMNGEPIEVISRASRTVNGLIGHIYTSYQFDEALITSEACWEYPRNYPFQMNFTVDFEKAAVTFINGELTVYTQDGQIIKPELAEDFAAEEDSGINISSLGAYYSELDYFVSRIIDDSLPEIAPLSEAVKSLELCLEEIKQSGGCVI